MQTIYIIKRDGANKRLTAIKKFQKVLDRLDQRLYNNNIKRKRGKSMRGRKFLESLTDEEVVMVEKLITEKRKEREVEKTYEEICKLIKKMEQLGTSLRIGIKCNNCKTSLQKEVDIWDLYY